MARTDFTTRIEIATDSQQYRDALRGRPEALATLIDQRQQRRRADGGALRLLLPQRVDRVDA